MTTFARGDRAGAARTSGSNRSGPVAHEHETAALGVPGVRDAWALERTDSNGQSWCVLYVVAEDDVREHDIQRAAARCCPAMPIRVCRVTSLPVDADGRRDEKRLLALPVVDQALIDALQARCAEAHAGLTWGLELDGRRPAASPAGTHVVAASAPASTYWPGSCVDVVKVVTVPSLSTGDDSCFSTERSVADLLVAAARRHPEKGCIFTDEAGTRKISYRDLFDAALRVVTALRTRGAVPGQFVLLVCDDSALFLPAFWGAILAGLVPVPASVPLRWADDDAGLGRLQNAYRLFATPWVLTDEASIPKVCSGLSMADASRRAVVGIQSSLSCAPSDDWYTARPDAVALMLLTSGSMGIPKAVTQSHRSLVHQVAAAALRLGLSDRDTSLNWFALDHVGGLVMFHLRDVAAAIDQVQVPTRRVLGDPLLWLDLIERWRVTVTWAPNFGYGLVSRALLQRNSRSWNLRNVRVCMNGGESIVRSTAREFLATLAGFGLAPDAMICAWGMSETCSAVTYEPFDPRADVPNGERVAVGRPIPGIELRIVDDDNAIIDEGNVGRLQIRGATVTSGYYCNPLADAESRTADGWFVTGDLGVLRDGRLSIMGRDKDVVIVNGLSLPCHELDAVVERVEGVSASFGVVVPVQAGSSEEVAVFIHCELPRERWQAVIADVRTALLRSFAINPRYILPVGKDEFLKTAIGKIQRVGMARRLASRHFQADIDQLGQSHSPTGSVPDWFFVKRWSPKKLVRTTGSAPQITFVFWDSSGLALELCGSQTGRVIRIDAGDAFEQRGPDHYAVNASRPEDYRSLFGAVVRDAETRTRVLHLWSYGQREGTDRDGRFLERARALSFDSLVLLALSKTGDMDMEILAVSSDVHGDHVDTAFERALISAFAEQLGTERLEVRLRQVDLEFAEHPSNARIVAQELIADGRDLEVVYRRGKRCVASLIAAESTGRPEKSPLRREGCYLITGGLGGIGFHVARWLLSTFDARLLLLGREDIGHMHTTSDGRRERLEALELLGSVRYAAADVADAIALARAVEEAETAWSCSIDGVFHFAGVYAAGPLVPGSDRSCAHVLRAKVAGSWTLERQFADAPEVFFVNASSALTLIHGAGHGAYTAANGFVEAFTRAQRAHRRAWCFAWTMWDGVGIARDVAAKILMQRKGLRAMPCEDALVSLELMLQQDEPVVWIGLDAARSPVKRLLSGTSPSYRALACWPALAQGAGEVREVDDFGVLLDHRIVAAEDVRSPDGSVDRQADAFEGPSTEAEKALAALWIDILGVPRVGRRDNFFEHGGTSLTAAELLVAAHKRFGRRLGFASLMTRPTLEALAQALAGDDTPGDVRLLVPLQTQGVRPAFFGMHPLFGLVYPYAALARELGANQPFYALQARAYVPGQEPHSSIEDMAKDYVRAIRQVQPQGPYYLGGWSFGSLIAMEMAQQLKAAGETVGCLAVIDQATDSLQRFFDEVPTRIKLVRFFSIVGNAMRAYDPYFATHRGWKRLLARPVTLWKFIRSVFVPMVRIGMINTDIARNYLLKPYEGDVALLHTGDPEFTRITDERLGWDRLVTGRVAVYRIPGNHLTLHEAPNVTVLARSLTDALDAGRVALESRS